MAHFLLTPISDDFSKRYIKLKFFKIDSLLRATGYVSKRRNPNNTYLVNLLLAIVLSMTEKFGYYDEFLNHAIKTSVEYFDGLCIDHITTELAGFLKNGVLEQVMKTSTSDKSRQWALKTVKIILQHHKREGRSIEDLNLLSNSHNLILN
ncbi:uncharacterized protein CELE_H04D03.7 [Caenorhabditis elegans]|uniref:Uncharacterized protein n=1 Tax=Caenorhabditis elegans TaxID=6239 RepID=A0A679L8H9_CAEEL|nr:Uncharacterized protein CELE_H04D03.7 [Caenorhabditis elegans]CAA9991432.1 Uncharacterized protein CELE_H04D03.7 [Caenorhabditis elegans]